MAELELSGSDHVLLLNIRHRQIELSSLVVWLITLAGEIWSTLAGLDALNVVGRKMKSAARLRGNLARVALGSTSWADN